MLRKRVIVCIDVNDGRAITAENPRHVRDLGDPVVLAQRYESEGADEIMFHDISTATDARTTLLDLISRTAQSLFIPLTVAGPIDEVSDIALILRAGADKVSINTAGVNRPELISEASVRFGKECVIATIDARLEKRQIELVARTAGQASPPGPPASMLESTWFRVFTHGGRTATELDAVAWARQCAAMGAGEILVTNIDQHRRGRGYDLELTARVVEAVGVPVIANGGAGSAEHIRDVFLLAGADAAIGDSVFHDGTTSVRDVKRILSDAGVPVRPVDASPLTARSASRPS
jgi:cyclase